MRLLLIEDSERLRRSLAAGLRHAGYAVDLAADGVEGLWYATENEYDVIVLDLMLPGLDGLSLLGKLRASGRQTHVLILSARDLVEDRVRGLDLGADDYLAKPFSFDELRARIQALVRRAYGSKSPVVRLGEMEVDLAARRVRRGDEILDVTPREFAVLELLLRRRGEVVTRREFWEHLYEFDAESSSNVLDVLIYSLRSKLGPRGRESLIQTRRGTGYMIDKDPA